MKVRQILITVVVGLVIVAAVTCQPQTYTVSILKISQPDARTPVSMQIISSGERYLTFSGAPVVMEFAASGFECPHQDISFTISYLYRRVRPDNFLEDPSLYVMEGYMTTTTIASETCSASWTSPGMRDGIHTIGILAFDGSGAQSPWYYITIIKNNERAGGIAYFPGGDEDPGTKIEEPVVSAKPEVIIDTPDHTFSINRDPVQYIDIHFHTTYPFPVEYFYVEWTFVSDSGCSYYSDAIVYPTGFNEGVFRLDMSSVFASEWDEPSEDYGKCAFGAGKFTVKIYCKTAKGLGEPSSISITLS